MAEQVQREGVGGGGDAAAAVGDRAAAVEQALGLEALAQRGSGRKACVAGSSSSTAGTLTLPVMRPGRP